MLIAKINQIEHSREELYMYIDRFGFNDERTVQKSQELDKALNGMSLAS